MEAMTRTALAWLLTYAIHSTVLLTVAWLLSRWGRLSMHTVDFIWKLALVGGLLTSTTQLALDVRPSGSFALEAARRPVPTVTSGSTTELSSVRTDESVHTAVQEHTPTAPATAVSPVVSPEVHVLSTRAKMELLLFAAWALVALTLALVYIARRLMLVGRLANRQQITEGTLPAMLDSLRRAVGFRSHVSLTSVNTISSPVALGLHEICVPEAAITELSTDEQRGLLAHELAHLARRDPVWLDVASLMERVFFFQPLNRLARQEIQRNAEFLCDDWAAERTGNGLPLAHCLARVAEWIEASPLGVPVAGMAEQRSLLVTRIARLIEGRRASSPLSRVLTIGTATLLLSAVVAAAPGVRRVQGLQSTPMPVAAEKAESKTAEEAPETSSHIDEPTVPQMAVREPRVARNGQAEGDDPAVVAALIARLQDADAGVRRAAAGSLGNLRSKTAVPALIAAIGDSNKEVRQAICEALGHIGDARAVPALTRLLSDASPDVRHRALDALQEFTDDLSARQIIPSTQDARSETRAKAAELLGEIGDQDAIPTLQRLLTDTSEDVRTAALESLCELKAVLTAKEITTLLGDVSADVRKAALEYIKEQPSLANVTTIRRMLSDADEHVREQAVEALSELRSPEARATLREALTSTDPAVRRRAAEALGERP
jgi:HEAT repeat protein/beta-lactamase regulating signal transducer with metallopeptidase domain